MKTKPRARKEGLVVQTLPDETLVYDLERDVAHCLNRSAALVWERCDGQSTTKQIARAVSVEIDLTIDERFIWLALDQLKQKKLLAEIPDRPSTIDGMNRRTALRALGISAVALPVVASILAPTPAQAASCLHGGSPCTDPTQCCSGICDGTCIGG
jgi:hypothetical protein